MELNIKEVDGIAYKVFSPVYPVIAEQIKDKTGINKGLCLDIGAVGGYLGMELSKITDLSVCLSDKMLKNTYENIRSNGLGHKVKTLLGNVNEIPIKDESINLVISRALESFWADIEKIFKEIYRVLTPGGTAYIGGRLGISELKDQVPSKMKKRNKEGKGGIIKKLNDNPIAIIEKALYQAEIKSFAINMDESGVWVTIRRLNTKH
ncbi:hypothetical protein CPJCM30710_19400 [Clostridium polyendosporum]|uniref:Methyltransferase type 11 domain-containing protein n=1 Tax=Clostridium polyendosporum TaxID=69208 RepID=A0A919RZV1_9CLOT|nr:class I SAM-dependent methyltransferase [Clostridium polyendosporum]GIM29274.1 hypothetical protein CPJCM30710_19400 [Clostridium polyendosporum]